MSASALRVLKLGTMMLAALGAPSAPADPREDVPVVHAAGSGDLESRVGRLENLVQSNGLLDLLSQVQQLQEEVRQLRGQIDTQSHQMEELNAKQAKLYDDLERRLQALDHGGQPGVAAAAPPPANPSLPTVPATAAPIADQGAGNQASSQQNPQQNPQTAAPNPSAGNATAPAPGTAPAAGGQPTQGAAPAGAAGGPAAGTAVAALAPTTATPQNAAANAGGNPDEDYKKALDLLKRNRYDEAIAVLNNFLVSYPNHPNAESAEYWLGEAYYVSKQYPAAISEFQKFVQAYPKSTKLSQVLLKTGFSYHELGQIDQAKTTLEEVKQRFPGTTAANMADQRLQRIRMEQKS